MVQAELAELTGDRMEIAAEPLTAEAFAVMMWQDGGPRDETFVKLPAPVTVHVPQMVGGVR